MRRAPALQPQPSEPQVQRAGAGPPPQWPWGPTPGRGRLLGPRGSGLARAVAVFSFPCGTGTPGPPPRYLEARDLSGLTGAQLPGRSCLVCSGRPAPASRAPGPGSCSEPLGDAVCPQPQLPSHRVADPAVASEALRGKKIKRLFLNAHDADGATSAVCFEPASGGGGPDARLLWGSRGQVRGWRVPGKSHAQQERHESNTITE